MGLAKKTLLGVLFLSALAGLDQRALAQSASPWRMSAGQGNFLLLSDIHFDPYADPTLVPKLAEAPVDQWGSIFGSSPQKIFSTYGKDTNYPLLVSALEEIHQTGTAYDYVLVNGDYLSHHFKDEFHKLIPGADAKAYQAFVLKTVVFVSREVQESLPAIPVYFCLGNNDSDCDDYGGVITNSAFLPTLAREWSTVSKDPEAVEDFSRTGCYVLPHPTLPDHEFIVLNDVVWAYKYAPSCAAGEGSEGSQELAWFQKVLKEARSKRIRATIVTHMPPGIHGRNASEHIDRVKPQKTFYKGAFLTAFLGLASDYRDVIDGEFSGHTHLDDFRVVSDRLGKNFLITHITPALSPVHNNNPGFQVMLYDRGNGGLDDMATYYLKNLKTAGTEPAQWSLEYTFKNAYGYDAYNSANLTALTDLIDKDPKTREKFVGYCSVSSTEDPPINLANWTFFNCAHTHLDPTSYGKCYR